MKKETITLDVSELKKLIENKTEEINELITKVEQCNDSNIKLGYVADINRLDAQIVVLNKIINNTLI